MPLTPDFYVQHEKGHKWDRCGFCGIMVICGTCGNNCCNGGSGESPDGGRCPDCKSAYEYQDEYWDEAEIFYDGMIELRPKPKPEIEFYDFQDPNID